MAWIVVMALAGLFSCYTPMDYRGDGALIDRGRGTATQRYIVDLGPVAAGTSTFRLANLPREVFTVGVGLPGLDPDAAREAAASANVAVEIRLVGDRQGTVLRAEAPLSEWVWTCGVGGDCSSAFAYRRPADEEARTGGTYFRPDKRSEYEITVTATDVAGFLETRHARLVARGGGWK